MARAETTSVSPVEKTQIYGEKTNHIPLHDVEIYSVGEQEQLAERAGTKRNIKSRHAQMIAIGGSIGTGFFLGAGQALVIGGPAFLFLAYFLMAVLVYGNVTAVIEMSTFLPISGASISYYAGRFVSPSLGFALGWLYFYSFGIIVAYELIAVAVRVQEGSTVI